ncbi:MAG: Proline-tRNA ligase, partial [Candidatus Peregrinibacteria bacterium GW2011_GWA2_47_7]
MAAVVEIHNDENGIRWPKTIAPYQIHLMHIGEQPEVIQKTQELYEQLKVRGFEVLYDDREASAGIKLNDADLMGIPLRLLVSKKTLEKQGVEWKLRAEKDSRLVTFDQLMKEVADYHS